MVDIYCCINSGAIWGIEPYVVKVEADISQGMPCFNMVGLLSSEVREARERVRSAIKNSGESLPMYRVTVNLSPADRRKEGTGYDLPIALALLCAMGRINVSKFENTLIMGELGLDGNINRVNGILPIINMAKRLGFDRCVIPKANSSEARYAEGIKVYTFSTLKEVIEYFSCNNNQEEHLISDDSSDEIIEDRIKDFSDIYGQESVKRAIIIAVSGWHNMLMIGAPGVGKSMLACRVPYIMMEMSEEEKREVLNIQSVCGLIGNNDYILKRPYSAPHHTITKAALIGGGKEPSPGEITVAHKGVMFLDELPEFSPVVLDSLRQPLEEKIVKIHRVNSNYEFPADCLIIAAMNPCKCGYYPDRNRCKCSETDVMNYLNRVSGPIIDRIDMSVEVPRVEAKDIGNLENNMTSREMKEVVERAVKRQRSRQNGKYNSQLSTDEIRKYCKLGREETDFMKDAYTKFGLSMRGYYKIVKIARTIADIEETDSININHLAESLGYRLSENRRTGNNM